jgi:osmoprotectant transport system permease protein
VKYALLVFLAGCASHGEVRVGSKKFTESVLLGELAELTLQHSGVIARHRRELGGTRVVYEALVRGDIDLYAEYTGTIRTELVPNATSDEDARIALGQQGIVMSRSLGFDDTYALGMNEARANALGIRTISDLAAHPELKIGLSDEFMRRKDGWPALRERYALSQRDVRGMDHELAYRGLRVGAIDVTDLYSTDAEVKGEGLRVLIDDRQLFPVYDAVFLYRRDVAERDPRFVTAIASLEGRITADEMATMNARAKLTHVPESRVAADFLNVGAKDGEALATRIIHRTVEHLALAGGSLLFSILVAVPLGIVASRRPRVGQLILAIVGVVQTIPSLALLVVMIPLLGIGAPPALAALFFYGLLPIVRNTYIGLHDISPSLLESADALGLGGWARLRLVELPLASRAILGGIKTAAVINVGTATLGALVGAGGYGQPILTGIRLASTPLILEGAIPAALLALGVEALFGLVERYAVPRGLRRR